MQDQHAYQHQDTLLDAVVVAVRTCRAQLLLRWPRNVAQLA